MLWFHRVQVFRFFVLQKNSLDFLELCGATKIQKLFRIFRDVWGFFCRIRMDRRHVLYAPARVVGQPF